MCCRLLYSILFLLVWQCPLAQADAATDSFGVGVSAFAKGDYTHAISAFEAAHLNGLDTPALHFNLAVSYYHSGAYAKAQERFLWLAEQGHTSAVIWYNLGLVALAEQKTDQADHYFRKISTQWPNDPLARLAEAQLHRLRPSSIPDSNQALPWRVHLGLGGGHESNVNQLPERASNMHDAAFSDVMAYAHTQLPNTHKDTRWSVWAHLRHRDYADLHESNLTQAEAGTLYGRTHNQWLWEAGLETLWLGYGNRELETRQGLVLGFGKSFSEGRWQLGYRGHRISAAERHSGYDGHQQSLGAQLFLKSARHPVQLHYRFEMDRRDDLSLPDAFYSFSANRHKIAARSHIRLTEKLMLTPSIEYRYSTYQDAHRYTNDDATVVNEKRRDHRYTAGLGATYHLAGNHRIYGHYVQQMTDSSLGAYTYQRTELKVGWEWLLPH